MITEERVVFYARMALVGYVLGLAALIGTTDGFLDHKPLGKDFAGAYAAGTLALQGHPEQSYDVSHLLAVEAQIFQRPDPEYVGWFYPPVFLLVAAPLALVPYLPALALWLALTAAAYVGSLRKLWPQRHAVLFALAWPAFMVNLLYGQNAFLSTALLGGGLLLLESSPIAAGILFGSLCFKPQLGVLLPFALLAGRHWRAFGAAAATVLALTMLTVLLFGAETWSAFLEATPKTRAALEQGAMGFYQVVTPFAAARQLGADVGVAWALQGTAALALLGVVVWTWRSRAAGTMKAALLVAAIPLSTPFALAYDLLILVLPAAWLAQAGMRGGFMPWERAAIGAVALLPALAPPLAWSSGLPLALAVEILFLALVVRRLRAELQLR